MGAGTWKPGKLDSLRCNQKDYSFCTFLGGRRGEGRREEEDEEERGEISKILESRFKLALTFVVFTFSMRFS